jgi:DNA-binding response OmpR family regulator
MKVMLVEDDDSIRELVTDLLSTERGHDVLAYAAAEEAWEACQREDFPLVLLDWMLPGMDGLQLCRQMREGCGKESVILVMTARTRPEDLAAVLDAGADDYLSKPLNLDLLDVRLTIAERRVQEVAARVAAQRAAEESAKLEGVLLAARTAAHEINNALSLPVGFAELLTMHPTVMGDPALLQQVTDIRDNVERASEILMRLQSVIRLQETPSPLGPDRPLLDLERSVE